MHSRAVVALVAFVALALAALSACTSRDERDTCGPGTAPGVVIYQGGIDLLIRDTYGRGEALGTVVTAHLGPDSIRTTGDDTLHVHTGFPGGGIYSVRVTRRFYRDTVVPNVEVLSGDCSFLVTHLAVTLTLVPNAPPLRSVAIIGTTYLVTPGEQSQFVAHVDADPGVDQRVTWRLSDTTLARIDDTGRVTEKCSLAGGVDTVQVAMVADTLVKAVFPFGVQKQASCP